MNLFLTGMVILSFSFAALAETNDLILSRSGDSLKAQPGLLKAEFIFETPPTPSCHAGTIVETKSGLISAWFAGTAERNPDVCIWLSRSEQGQWTTPQKVVDGVQHTAKRYPCWNPVLFQPKDGPLLLFYKVGPSPSEWWGMVLSSKDEGKTWSEPRRLPEDVIGPVKNKPVQMPGGEILCGASTENSGWRIHFERTFDLGRTWEIIPIPDPKSKIGAIQPTILFHKNGRLQALVRTDQGRIFQTWSKDRGNTWSKLAATDLPNPNSGIDAVTLCDGRQLLVYNHTKDDRSPLNVAVSQDGKKWDAALVLENEAGQEFSYPAAIQAHDGTVHIVYTWHRTRIKHVAIDTVALTLNTIVNKKWPQ